MSQTARKDSNTKISEILVNVKTKFALKVNNLEESFILSRGLSENEKVKVNNITKHNCFHIEDNSIKQEFKAYYFSQQDLINWINKNFEKQKEFEKSEINDYLAFARQNNEISLKKATETFGLTRTDWNELIKYLEEKDEKKRENKQIERYNKLYTEILEIDDKHNRNEELYIDGLIDKTRFTELKNKLEEKEIELKKEFSKEHKILKSEIFKETSKKGLTEIVKNLQEQIEYFFDNATYEDLKELVNIVIDKIIIPTDKEKSIQIIMKIPGGNISFQEKYLEDEFVEFTDEQGKTYNICETGRKIPKLLNLATTNKSHKYRSVIFKEDIDKEENNNSGLISDNNDYENYEGIFLDFLKEKFYQFGECDQ